MTKEHFKLIMGKNIRSQRASRNMSLDELAELLELTSGFVGLIERGERGVTTYNLFQLARIFNVPADSFCEDPENSKSKLAEMNPCESKTAVIQNLCEGLNEPELDLVITVIRGLKNIRTKTETPETIKNRGENAAAD